MTEATLPPAAAPQWWRVSDEELAAIIREAEREKALADARQTAALAEALSRGVLATYGCGTPDAFLRELLRIDLPEARRRVLRARALHDTREASAVRPASAPLTAEAAAAGELGAGHVDAIAEAMSVLPADLADDERAGYESTLLELARQATPAQVRRAGRRIAALVDQDREPQDKPDPDLAEPQRELRWWWSRRNRFKFTGELDHETGTLLETLLSALAKPRPSVAGDRDPRDTGQRQGDAFAELLEFTHRATGRPTEAGEAPVVIVTMTLEQLLKRNPLISAADTAAALREADRQTATLNWDSPITAEQARRLACDANLVPAVLGGHSEVLDLGRQARTASRAQRRALALRDRGCIMCSRPVRWTQVHHNDEWDAHHGPTDIDNLCLLCGACHRMVHHGGWQIRLNADRLPEVIPPAWVDPQRKPRRYTGAHTEPLS